MNREIYKCSICNKPVIGLASYEFKLDSFYYSEFTNYEGYESLVEGTVHLNCLREKTDQYDFWKKSITKHFEKLAIRYSDNIFFNKNSLQIIEMSDENILLLPVAEIKSIDEEKKTILMQHEINVNLQQIDKMKLKLLKKIISDEVHGGLNKLIDMLNLSEYYTNNLFQNSILKPFDDEPKETFFSLNEYFFSGLCRYQIRVTSEFIECLKILR